MVTKMEVTLSIDSKVVNSVKHTGPLDIQVIGDAAAMVTNELIEVMQSEQAEQLEAESQAEVERHRLEAEAEAQEREELAGD